ncbi:hypothetical protein HCN44_000196 [Aphidius gifuensis]|uniref:Uncharacterized protein n=1 Tax=Aphidius gifuensis TaxID=684658 RepID=A0A834XT94_APHGI|nr:P3 protein-like [Aphidius gifuensis]KAF7990391.1 hypothetical protein HCN44_000196 [Aphidius gifuensis]
MIRKILFGFFLICLVNGQEWSLKLNRTEIKIKIDDTKEATFNISFPKIIPEKWKLIANTSDEDLVSIEVPEFKNITKENIVWNERIKIKGLNLGKTKITLNVITNEGISASSETLLVTIIRPERLIDTIFVISVATLVSILYINFGCAIDWQIICETMKKPIGPLIGGVCQFIIMPLIAFGIGQILFPNNPEMQIGIFFTGISPSGGASNMWTLLLGGNLNLSIAMTALSTLAAFVTIPLWVFTLGKYILEKGKLRVPYRNISTMAIGLIIPLGIGFLIQKKYPKLCKTMVRITKTFSSILILFIVIFAIITNFYLFKLFSWRIVLAGMGLPWLGFMCGLIAMTLFKQPVTDIKAIAIETGIQNTGIAIFLLKFSMSQPEADLTTVIPVSVAVMTPLPLLIGWIIKIVVDKKKKKLNGSSEIFETDHVPVTINSKEKSLQN